MQIVDGRRNWFRSSVEFSLRRYMAWSHDGSRLFEEQEKENVCRSMSIGHAAQIDFESTFTAHFFQVPEGMKSCRSSDEFLSSFVCLVYFLCRVSLPPPDKRAQSMGFPAT